MKIQKLDKKLVLKKNTVADLSQDQMNKAFGGASILSCLTYRQCCYTEEVSICPTCEHFSCPVSFCC